jgi:hypothetical protein
VAAYGVGMRVIAAFVGPYAPEALTLHGSVFFHDFKRFERLTKLATGSCSVFSQCFGFLPVGGVTPLGEPAVDQHRLHASNVRDVTRGRRCRQR